jgi:hypothetical protein
VTDPHTEGWRHLGDRDGWKRTTDNTQLLPSEGGWDVVLQGKVLGRIHGAETARRLCDYGQFEREGVPPLYEFPDDAGLPALLDCIRHLHGLEATWLESVPVKETHEGQTVWEGEVQVFAAEHPKATRVYAWSHETTPGKRRFHAVLGQPPVKGAIDAVRVAVRSESSR